MNSKTILKVKCMDCGADMGEKDGKGVTGISHGICEKCWNERYPEYPYLLGEPLMTEIKLLKLAKYRDRKQQELERALSLTARIRVAQGRAGGLPK